MSTIDTASEKAVDRIIADLEDRSRSEFLVRNGTAATVDETLRARWIEFVTEAAIVARRT